MSDTCGILAPSYRLGEEQVLVETIVNRKAVLGRYNMPDKQAFWGWGWFRRTKRSRAELACETARDTIARSRLSAADIDALIVCCGDGLNYHAQNLFISELSSDLDLDCDFVSWIGGAGCASLFSAVASAKRLVLEGAFQNVLVINVDKLEDEDARFQRYAVFSDGACSFIVRGGGEVDFTIAGVAVSSSLAYVRNQGQDVGNKCQLIYSVFERLAGEVAFPFAGSALLASNVFLPIQDLELSVMPVDGLVAYRSNTARYGHCSGSDPVINLVDFYADSTHRATQTSVMMSSAHGHVGVMLLERGGAGGELNHGYA